MTFQPPSKSLTARDYVFIAVVAVFVVAVSVGLTAANLSLPRGGGEFLRHWAGIRGFTFERIDPYSAYAPDTAQQLVYGGKAGAGDDPYILDTPFHLLLLYAPFSLLSDPETGRAIFTLTLEWALFALAALSLRLAEWTLPRWFMLSFFLVSTLNFYTFQALLAASPILLLGLNYAGILLALRNEQDELAGALAALSLYAWAAGLPFLALIAWRSYKEGRARVFAGFGMLSAILLAVSFLLYPNWIIPYLRAGMNDLRAAYGFSVATALQLLLPSYGRYIAWGIIAALVFALGYEWSALQPGDHRRLYWVACLSIAAAPLLGFRAETENLAALIMPLTCLLSVAYDRWRNIGAWIAALLLLAILSLPWALYFIAVPLYGQIANGLMFLFLPLFTVIGLYWIRWWAIHPPRVWADTRTR